MPQASPSALPESTFQILAALTFAAVPAAAIALIAGGLVRRLLDSVRRCIRKASDQAGIRIPVQQIEVKNAPIAI